MIEVNFTKGHDLIPAIIQDLETKRVLMLGYMNKDSLQKTLTTGYVYFWSRTRKRLWLKGESSGDKLLVKKVFVDCDRDSLLILAKMVGNNVCHTGKISCFYEELKNI